MDHLLGKPTIESLVILGEMSIHGAKRVLLPSENKRDFADIPSDILDKMQIIFYSDPINAAFRAMGLD